MLFEALLSLCIIQGHPLRDGIPGAFNGLLFSTTFTQTLLASAKFHPIAEGNGPGGILKLGFGSTSEGLDGFYKQYHYGPQPCF